MFGVVIDYNLRDERFCPKCGHVQASKGRRFLESNSNGFAWGLVILLVFVAFLISSFSG